MLKENDREIVSEGMNVIEIPQTCCLDPDGADMRPGLLHPVLLVLQALYRWRAALPLIESAHRA